MHRVTMNSRYEIRNGSNIVAYVNEGNAGYTITPVKLNGDNLNSLMRAIDHGRIPEGFTKRHTNLYLNTEEKNEHHSITHIPRTL